MDKFAQAVMEKSAIDPSAVLNLLKDPRVAGTGIGLALGVPTGAAIAGKGKRGKGAAIGGTAGALGGLGIGEVISLLLNRNADAKRSADVDEAVSKMKVPGPNEEGIDTSGVQTDPTTAAEAGGRIVEKARMEDVARKIQEAGLTPKDIQAYQLAQAKAHKSEYDKLITEGFSALPVTK